MSACGPSVPSPSLAAPTPTSSALATGPTALDECDPLGLIACEQQAAFISVPITDTGLALTYSSQWARGRTDRPGWDAAPLGLGGWSIDVVQRYMASPGVLVSGDGSWRFATAVKLAAGGTAVPAYDGSVAYVFDAAGRHVQTVDGHLGTSLLTITYDAGGRLATADGTSGGRPVHLSIKRAADGTAQAIVGMDGASTALGYDGQGHLTSLTDPAGRTTAITWAPGDLVTSETDPLGGVSRYTYDQDGRLVATRDADGVTQQFVRTATPTSIALQATTAMGRVTSYRTEMADSGITRTVVAPDGTTTTETAAADGSRTLALPDGSTRSIGIQASAVWGTAAPLLTPDVTRRPDGVTSRTEIKQALQPIAGVPYTVNGTVTTTTNGQTSVVTFDPASRTTTTVDGAGRRTMDAFDAAGRVISETAPPASATTYTYDAQGRQASVTVGTGSAAQTSRFAYDATTGHETVTRPDGTVVTLGVDAIGDLTTQTTTDGSTVVAAYDANGRPTQVQPAGGLTSTLGYSPAGRPTLFLPPAVSDDASAQITTYDADGLATSLAGLGSRAVAVTYDASGRVASWTFDQGTAKVTYDPSTGLQTTSQDPSGEVTTYGYAGAQLDAMHWSGSVAGSVSTTLDPNGRPSGESVDGAPPVGLTYDGAGDLTGVGQLSFTRDQTTGLATGSVLGAVTTGQRYDGANRLIRSTTTASGKVVLDLQYTRDALGRIVGVIQATPSGTTTIRYTFDGSDRLASVQVNGKSVQTDTYDAAGDRTLATGNSTARGTYDARGRLTGWGDTTYAWSPDGTLASISGPTGRTTFHYDGLGQLRSVSLADGRAVTYIVDADGRRLGRSVGGVLQTAFLYDPAGELVAEADGSGKVVAQFGYDDQGQLALVERDGHAYRVITDPNGSPRLVVDAQSGAVAEAIDYDAWGRITRDTAPGFIPFGFAGGLLDPDTGLVHLGARDYDPVTGRWTAQDPIRFAGGDADLYRYAAGDPVNRTDPSGMASPGVSGCYGYACGQANGSWPDLGYNVRGCIGPACVDFCGWGLCSKHPSDPFTCVGLFCTHDVCIYSYCASGDTHMYTGDKVHFDFQAAGEFMIAASPGGDLEIQARQEPVMGGTVVTFNTAVAANVVGDRVGVYANEPSFLIVNGKPVSAADVAEQLPHGGSIERHGGRVTVGWPDGSRLVITRNSDTLDYTLAPSKDAGPTLHGLLGSADGNPANDLTGRDGQVLSRSDPDFQTKLYSQFGNSWRITQAESLFDYGPGESTATFTNLAIPSAEATVASLDPSPRAKAQAICQAAGVRIEPLLDDCVLDVGETGDASFAAATAAVAAAGGVTASNAGTSPAQVTPITVGQTESGQIASAAQEDDYTFTATAGQIVYLQTHVTCTGPLAWHLLGPNGSDLAGSQVCNDLGRVALPSEGTYTIAVNKDRSTTGAYGFTLSSVPATVVTPVSPGQTVNGSISTAGQWADYTFQGAAGQTFYVQRSGSCTPQISWDLRGPDQAPILSTGACNDLGRAALTTSGTYTIRLYGNHTATGAFSFTLLAVPATVVTPITIGQAVSGSLTAPGQWADYTFQGSAGEVITAHATGVCVDGLGWQLLGPSGNLLDFTVSCHDMNADKLLTSGTFTIRIAGSNTAVGAYAFTIRAGP